MNSARSSPLPRALTIVELLVVIAIIGVLAGLLLPAVQAARESARRIQCMNNLKQLALATLNYEQDNSQLPTSGNTDVRMADDENALIVNPWGGRQLGWAVFLLPWLEQQTLYDQFNLERSINRQSKDILASMVPNFRCPSDDARGQYYELPGFPATTRIAKGNYAAYVSPFHVDLQLLYRGALVAGGQRLAAVTDGASRTLILSEVRTLDSNRDERGAWALPWAGASVLAFDVHPTGWSHDHDGTGAGDEYVLNASGYTANPDSIGEGQPPNNQGPNSDTLKACVDESEHQQLATDARMPCVQAHMPGLKGYMSAAPRSLHPGGVNAAYLDGRVDWLDDDIDQLVMAYLVAINDSAVHESR